MTDYLVSAKFTNDSNFFVREVGRGSGVLERRFEIGEVLRGGDNEDKKPVCTHFGKKGSGKFICLSISLSVCHTLVVHQNDIS